MEGYKINWTEFIVRSVIENMSQVRVLKGNQWHVEYSHQYITVRNSGGVTPTGRLSRDDKSRENYCYFSGNEVFRRKNVRSVVGN